MTGEQVVNNEAQQQDQPKKINIFISYRWNETKMEVRNVADYLKTFDQFDVWIDTEEMFGDKNERMEEGIRRSHIVVIFFNDEYQNSRDCRKEAESADRNGKIIVFVKMQRPRCQFQSWFAPIVGNNFFVDYYKYANPGEEILKHIHKVMASELNNKISQTVKPSNKSRFVTVKVPKFGKYQNRPDDERNICEAIRNICTGINDSEGALVICGGGGTGKTTIVAQMVMSPSDFLRTNCGINAVVWLNCFKWTGDAFDEPEFVRTLVELCEKAGEFSGCFQLEDVAAQFDRQDEKLLVVLDDVFNVKLLEIMRQHFAGVACLVVTRDVDELMTTHGLVSQVYRLFELDESAIIAMFESAYRLIGKLDRQQLTDLARLCNGLPIVVSLISARFQDCETPRDFAAECDCILDEVKVKDLKLAGPYGTVSKLFEFSLEQQDEEFRRMYYAFLMFNPAEPVNVEDLAIIWNCTNSHRALVRCRQMARKSLARPVVSSLSTAAATKSEAGSESLTSTSAASSNNAAIRQSEFFLIHQLLHEAAVDNAIKTHKLADNLTELRTKIVAFDGERDFVRIVRQALTQQRRQLLERIFDTVDVNVLVAGCQQKTDLPVPTKEAAKHITSEAPLLLYLYHFEWQDNGPKVPFGINHSYRLLRRFFLRLAKSGQTNVTILDLLAQQDPNGNCLLLQIFGSHYLQEHWSDRWRLADVLKPLGAYRIFNQLSWLKQCSEQSSGISQLFMAAANGDLEQVRQLAKASPYDVIAKSSMNAEIPLMAASRFGHVEIVKLLCELSQNSVNMVNQEGRNALMVAANNGNLETVAFLYEKTRNAAKTKDQKGRTAILLAAMNGNFDIVEFLYSKDAASLNDPDNAKRTALTVACRYGQIPIIKFCMTTAGAEYLPDINGMTPFQFAAANGHIDVVKMMCDLGGDRGLAYCKEKDYRGTTALMMAARKGHLDIVSYLFAIDNAMIEHRQDDGKNGLMLAAERNHLNVVQFVHERTKTASLAAHHVKDEQGNTALMLASKFGHLEIVQFLRRCDVDSINNATTLKAGVDLEDIYKKAFFLAVRHGHLEVVKVLAIAMTEDFSTMKRNNNKASGNETNNNSGNIQNLRNEDGQDAVEVATNAKHDATAEYLRKTYFV